MLNLSLSLVLPVRDAAATLADATNAAMHGLARTGADYEIILIDDGSQDATPAVADRLAAAHDPVMVTHRRRQRGYGAAILDGWSIARGSHVLVADLASLGSLSDLGRMLAYLDRYSAILGARVDTGGPQAGRRLAAAIAGARLGLPLRDPLYRFGLFRADLIAPHAYSGAGPAVHLAIAGRAHANGADVVQVDLPARPVAGPACDPARLRDVAGLRPLGAPAARRPLVSPGAALGAALGALAGGLWLMRRHGHDDSRNNSA